MAQLLRFCVCKGINWSGTLPVHGVAPGCGTVGMRAVREHGKVHPTRTQRSLPVPLPSPGIGRGTELQDANHLVGMREGKSKETAVPLPNKQNNLLKNSRAYFYPQRSSFNAPDSDRVVSPARGAEPGGTGTPGPADTGTPSLVSPHTVPLTALAFCCWIHLSTKPGQPRGYL